MSSHSHVDVCEAHDIQWSRSRRENWYTHRKIENSEYYEQRIRSPDTYVRTSFSLFLMSNSKLPVRRCCMPSLYTCIHFKKLFWFSSSLCSMYWKICSIFHGRGQFIYLFYYTHFWTNPTDRITFSKCLSIWHRISDAKWQRNTQRRTRTHAKYKKHLPTIWKHKASKLKTKLPRARTLMTQFLRKPLATCISMASIYSARIFFSSWIRACRAHVRCVHTYCVHCTHWRKKRSGGPLAFATTRVTRNPRRYNQIQ